MVVIAGLALTAPAVIAFLKATAGFALAGGAVWVASKFGDAASDLAEGVSTEAEAALSYEESMAELLRTDPRLYFELKRAEFEFAAKAQEEAKWYEKLPEMLPMALVGLIILAAMKR